VARQKKAQLPASMRGWLRIAAEAANDFSVGMGGDRGLGLDKAAIAAAEELRGAQRGGGQNFAARSGGDREAAAHE